MLAAKAAEAAPSAIRAGATARSRAPAASTDRCRTGADIPVRAAVLGIRSDVDARSVAHRLARRAWGAASIRAERRIRRADVATRAAVVWIAGEIHAAIR